MTLALIVVIVFLVVWAYQVAGKKIAAKGYKQRTKTDLQLQTKTQTDWEQRISDEINAEDIPLGELYDRIASYYNKYNMPPESYVPCDMYAYERDMREWRQKAIAKECVNEMQRRYHYWQQIDGIYFFDKYKDRVKIWDIAYKQRVTPATYAQYSDVPPLPAEQDTQTNMERIKAVSECDARFGNLIRLLTMKSLSEQGIHAWAHGKESDWQETERRLAEIHRREQEYPWLYPTRKK